MTDAAFTSATVTPARLPVAEREQLTDALHALHSEVFDGVDREAFRRHVIAPDADGNVVHVTRGPDGRAVAYAALHHVDLIHDGRPLRILRPTTAAASAYRGRGTADRFLAVQTTRLMLTAGRRRTYLLSTPISPVSFHWVHRGGARVWPDPARPTPPAIRRLMRGLADRLGLPVGAAGDPDVRWVGWIVRESDAERARIVASPSPAIRLYLERNPDYLTGEGLLMLVPIGWPTIIRGMGYATRRLLGRTARVGAARPGAHADRVSDDARVAV